MKHVFYLPWVGTNFNSGGIFKKKILVLGESHYCGEGCDNCGCGEQAEECAQFTSSVVTDYLNGNAGNWSKTLRKFERSLVNHETSIEESKEIWNSLAFYNYLPIAMDEPRETVNDAHYDNAKKAFFEVIDELLPDLIIVWGVGRMWTNMPAGERWRKGNHLEIDGSEVKNGYYRLDNGKEARVLWVYHPSAGYSWNWWNKVIKTEL